MIHRSRRILGIAIVPFAIACVPSVRSHVHTEIPPVAPDSTPSEVMRALRAPGNLIAAGFPDTIVKNALYVRFRDGTALHMRAVAIRAVDGEVIGGIRLGGTEGFYHIRIPVPADSGAGPLLRAFEQLNQLPQVRGVSLQFLHSPLSPH